MDLKIKYKTLKLWGKNGGKSSDFKIGEEFVDLISKAWYIKEKSIK